ncbi:MAG: HAMP domain-containing sensor histidine kinase [Spirochaetales bacterium]
MRSVVKALAVFLLVFAVVFVAGYLFSRDRWQQEATGAIHSVLLSELDHLLGQTGDLEGEEVSRALMNYLEPTVFAFVFRADGSLEFWSWHGKSWYEEDTAGEKSSQLNRDGDPTELLPAEDRPAAGETLFSHLQARGSLTPLTLGGRTQGYFWSGHHTFELIEENRQFLANLGWALLIGLLVAGLAASLSSWKAFQESSAQATRVQRALIREADLRRQWAQDIAHDLRTPLAGLRVQLEGLADGVLELGTERLPLLLGEVNRLEALTGDLLALGRLESPEMRPELKLCLLSELIPPLLTPLVELAGSRGRTWTSTVVDGTFDADPELLHRALANLLTNALAHAQGPGLLTVDWSASAGGVLVVITNPGRLAAEEQTFLFQRLHRGESSRNRPGNGLGLAIAKAIVELHGGTLLLQNVGTGRVEARLFLPSPNLHRQADRNSRQWVRGA